MNVTQYVREIATKIAKTNEEFAQQEIEKIIIEIFNSGDITNLVSPTENTYEYLPYRERERQKLEVSDNLQRISELEDRIDRAGTQLLEHDDGFSYAVFETLGILEEESPYNTEDALKEVARMVKIIQDSIS